MCDVSYMCARVINNVITFVIHVLTIFSIYYTITSLKIFIRLEIVIFYHMSLCQYLIELQCSTYIILHMNCLVFVALKNYLGIS